MFAFVRRPASRCLALLLALLFVFALLPSVSPPARAAAADVDEYEAAYLLVSAVRAGKSQISFTHVNDLDYYLVMDLFNAVYPIMFGLAKADFERPEATVTSLRLDVVEGAGWVDRAAEKAKAVAAAVLTPDMSDTRKIRALHDWLVLHCQYDHSATEADMLPFTAYGALVEGSAVCSGYANAMVLLLREAGIPVLRINGFAYTPDGIGHAWNAVLAEGAWLYVDATWDDSDAGSPRDTYFLVPEAVIAREHITEIPPYFRFLQYVSPARPDYAAALAERGLFKGMAAGDYQLDSLPDSAQGAEMKARLLGLNEDAPFALTHPFTDVPAWADAHLSFLFDRGLAKGTGGTTFSSSTGITLNDYLTFVLRAMGYKDDVDFTWAKASDFGKVLGLVTDDQLAAFTARPFSRADMVNITYAALSLPCADGQTLSDRLEQGVDSIAA
ncbi:MAG: hypothetical protein LBT60_00075 [Oscillospiraceae bacterium]|jgi:hypothetical protein|nr:hypothetical protein [Oscillospiraceae bacterium]